MIVRRSAFEVVGGFDSRIFLYMEDVDLCRRLRDAGWTIKYEPGAVADHEIGGSQGSEQSERWYAAFHEYLLAHRGRAAAVICAYMAALGLGGRAAIFSISKPAHARRLAAAARTALRLALRESWRALRRGA
jgi:GT2 family glycosyltransferase